MQSNNPKTSSARAIQIPAKTIQIRFRINEIKGIDPPVGTTSLPNGARCAIPIFMACNPHGIPIMVRHNKKPPHRYPIQVNKPPQINQITFPINRITLDLNGKIV
jgi:hypothetical protein